MGTLLFELQMAHSPLRLMPARFPLLQCTPGCGADINVHLQIALWSRYMDIPAGAMVDNPVYNDEGDNNAGELYEGEVGAYDNTGCDHVPFLFACGRCWTTVGV